MSIGRSTFFRIKLYSNISNSCLIIFYILMVFAPLLGGRELILIIDDLTSNIILVISMIFLIALFIILLKYRYKIYMYGYGSNPNLTDELILKYLKGRTYIINYIIFFASFVGLPLFTSFNNPLLALPFIVFNVVSWIYILPDRNFMNKIYKDWAPPQLESR